MVTPFVGVWIEINIETYISAPSNVTPFVGVWIEIMVLDSVVGRVDVTPFVGVWIEIFQSLRRFFIRLSLPSWECGLKSD